MLKLLTLKFTVEICPQGAEMSSTYNKIRIREVPLKESLLYYHERWDTSNFQLCCVFVNLMI